MGCNIAMPLGTVVMETHVGVYGMQQKQRRRHSGTLLPGVHGFRDAQDRLLWKPLHAPTSVVSSTALT